MNTAEKENRKPPKGYISEEAKRKFTKIAGVLGAVFLIGQVFIPLSVAFILIFFFDEPDTHRTFLVDYAVYWKEKIWYTETITDFKHPKAREKNLMSLDLEKSGTPDKITSLPIDGYQLLPDSDSLWIISSSSIGYYKGDTIYVLPMGDTTNNIIPRPFLYEGFPATFKLELDSIVSLYYYKDKQWYKRESITLLDKEFLYLDLEIIGHNRDYHFFLEIEGIVYYWKGFPKKGKRIWDYWKPIAKAKYNWISTLINSKPAFFHAKDDTIFGLIKRGNTWEKYLTYPLEYHSSIDRFGVIAFNERDLIIIKQSSYPDDIEIHLLENKSLVRKINYLYPEKKSELPPLAGPTIGLSILLYLILLPCILALIFTFQMPKYKKVEYTKNVYYASIGRRALSQFIDAIIIIVPIAIVFTLAISGASFFLRRYFILIIYPTAMLWAFVVTTIYSFFEGKWGVTVGKLVFKIQVLGTDLKPCGFGRALIRNLLKVFDGFFYFMVGIMIIALSDNWQRVGDLAARTIVVRKIDK